MLFNFGSLTAAVETRMTAQIAFKADSMNYRAFSIIAVFCVTAVGAEQPPAPGERPAEFLERCLAGQKQLDVFEADLTTDSSWSVPPLLNAASKGHSRYAAHIRRNGDLLDISFRIQTGSGNRFFYRSTFGSRYFINYQTDAEKLKPPSNGIARERLTAR